MVRRYLSLLQPGDPTCSGSPGFLFVESDMPTRVPLEPFEIDAARHVAERRTKARSTSKDAAHYDPSLMDESSLRQNTHACYAEIAVAKHTRQYWAAHWWPVAHHNRYRNMADVGDNTEVRHTRCPTNRLVVRASDAASSRVIVCACVPDDSDGSFVDLMGWMDAKEAWAVGSEASFDKSGKTRLVALSLLNPMG